MRCLNNSEGTVRILSESMESTREAEKENSQTPARILVVNNEKVVCGVLDSLLRGAGHQVQTCLSGQEAIARLKEGSFDLVITDLNMRRVDGLDVLRRAKELDPFCEVIVLTAYASVESSVQVMKLGAYDCISKPFSIDQIGIVVDRAIQKRRLLRAAEERDLYKHSSRIDAFTEVYNHRAFQELLEAEIARSERHFRPLSLLMIDLDDLKMYDDTSGHPAADVILKEVAWLLKKSVRNCDVVAKYGGNEFAIILVEANKADAISVADRLGGLLEEADLVHGDAFGHENHTVSATIGVASYPTDACQQTELVTKADQAVREAKALGDNLVRAAEQELALMGAYHEKRLYFLCKRCMDITLSLLLLIVTLPLFLFIALLIKVDSSGPVFFHQPRVGLRKRIVHGQTVWELTTFPMHKFRTMYHERGRGMHWQFMKALIQEDKEGVARLLNNSDLSVKKLTEDPRITRVGAVLRKTTLDELPQLWNVLKGEMSLVGPRPPIPYEIAEYEPRYWRRLEAIPGCTGLWQVSGWCTVGFEQQVELDVWYIEHQSLWLDMKILLQTVLAVLSRKGGG